MAKKFFLILPLCLLSCGGSNPDPIIPIEPTSQSSQSALAQDVLYPPVEIFEPEAQKKLFAHLRKTARQTPANLDRSPIPIFVITCDRISVLIKSLLSYYTRIETPIEIVIHDNNTTYPPTREFLKRLEKAGVMVTWSTRNVVHDYTLSEVRETIQDWYQSHDSPYYIVTDPDIEIEKGSEDILEVFAHVLRENPDVTVVGPMLRRDDLPDHYPLKVLVQKQQEEVYRHTPVSYSLYGRKVLTLQSGYIDSAFGMYRKDFIFHNYNKSLQLHDPYQARHLDWYIDPSNLTPDQIYYKQKNSPVGHWSSTWLPN